MKIRTMMAAALTAAIGACAADVPPPRTHVVEIRQFRFTPDTVVVSVGDTIRWINRDPVPHTATAGEAWDSGRMDAAGEWTMVVEAGAGGDYICSYHPNMIGTMRLR